MKCTFEANGKQYIADLDEGYDISIPYAFGEQQVNCFYAPKNSIDPVVEGSFVGSVNAGSPVNFYNVHINPHGNGTHTETKGHISPEWIMISQRFKSFVGLTKVISCPLMEIDNKDLVLDHNSLVEQCMDYYGTSLVIRTLPNTNEKQKKVYSGKNPAYVLDKSIRFLADRGVVHLLVDIPSLDRESDGGKVLAHKAFWASERGKRDHCTVTELIFVDNMISDGLYLLNLQVASFEMDAAPSRPVLYSIQEV